MPDQVNPRGHSARGRSAAWLSVLALAMVALLMPTAAAAVDGPGNNGTVKIHDGPGEPGPEVQNEPHVCSFHLHFYFADPVQSGAWQIEEWAPDDKGTLALSGTYDTAGDGEDRQPASGTYLLPDGHYKLFWDGDLDKHDKQKVFWVACAAPTPTPTPSPTPTPTPTPTPDSDPDSDSHAHPNPNPGDLADADSDSDSDAHPITHAHADSEPDPDPDAHAYACCWGPRRNRSATTDGWRPRGNRSSRRRPASDGRSRRGDASPGF